MLSAEKGPLAGAETRVPAKPGLYAIHGAAGAWRELGLGDPPDDRPLYVGKAEESLLARDINTHFGDGHTGSSTVRRSFAALLRSRLKLAGRPRNPAKPERFANYGLSPEDDAKLTAWMRKRLNLATWTPGKPMVLEPVEIELIQQWKPPLNLKNVATAWTGQVKDARRSMADEARAWRPEPLRPTSTQRSGETTLPT